MNTEKAQRLQHHAEAVAALHCEDTSPEQSKTLESIEKTVREKVLEHVSPNIAIFFIGKTEGRWRYLKSSVGGLRLTEGQAQKLGGEALEILTR
jgi:hypothetical protein